MASHIVSFEIHPTGERGAVIHAVTNAARGVACECEQVVCASAVALAGLYFPTVRDAELACAAHVRRLRARAYIAAVNDGDAAPCKHGHGMCALHDGGACSDELHATVLGDVESCADCGEDTDAPVYFMGTSARCPACHAKRMRDDGEGQES